MNNTPPTVPPATCRPRVGFGDKNEWIGFLTGTTAPECIHRIVRIRRYFAPVEIPEALAAARDWEATHRRRKAVLAALRAAIDECADRTPEPSFVDGRAL